MQTFDLTNLALFMGDNALILSHRLSELTGHAPVLEEELAIANVALDLLGQATMWLDLAAELNNTYKSADKLAFHREIWEFRNVALVEQPNDNFGHIIARQFFFDSWHKLVLEKLRLSKHKRFAEIAEKSLKEVCYHLERSSQWLVLLGDGTTESHRKVQHSIDYFWPYALELCESISRTEYSIDDSEESTLKTDWINSITPTLDTATLSLPSSSFAHSGGRQGIHTEHLGLILADMQCLPRAYPDAKW